MEQMWLWLNLTRFNAADIAFLMLILQVCVFRIHKSEGDQQTQGGDEFTVRSYKLDSS